MNNILVDSKYWKGSIQKNIGYGEKKEYFVLAYPFQAFSDYICKIPSEYVVLKNKKPSVISVWKDFIFEFEKEIKEPGKKFKRLKLSFDEVKELDREKIDNMRYCILAFCNYYFNTIIRKAECTSAEIKFGKTDGTWFYDLDYPQCRKKIKAKNTTFIKYCTEEDYLEYKRCLDALSQFKSNTCLLNEYLEDNQRHIKSSKDWYVRYNKTNQYTDEIFKRLKGISNYLNTEIEKIANAAEHDDVQRNIFKLVYAIDVKSLLGKLVKIEFKDGSIDISYSAYVASYDFPYIITSTLNGKKEKYLYHQLSLEDKENELIAEEGMGDKL